MIAAKFDQQKTEIDSYLKIFKDIIKYNSCPECDENLLAQVKEEIYPILGKFLQISCSNIFKYSDRSGASHFVQNISAEYDNRYECYHRFIVSGKIYEMCAINHKDSEEYWLGDHLATIKVKKDYSSLSKQELATKIDKLFLLK